MTDESGKVEYSHRDLARMACMWLQKRSWCYIAGFETALPEGYADVVGVSKVQALNDYARAEIQQVRDQYFEGIEADRQARLLHACGEGPEPPRRPRPSPPNWPRANPKPTIGVIEVKRTRSDLLSDLRRGKMLQYERWASHCWIAGTREAFGDVPVQDVAESLQTLGLPSTWGVLLLPTSGRPEFWSGFISPYKNAKRLRTPSTDELLLRSLHVGRAACYRQVKGDADGR